MAITRRNAMLIEEARNKIRTTQLVNRLQDHSLGKPILSESQVKAIAILLKKVIPDLANVEVSGEGGGPIVIYRIAFNEKLENSVAVAAACAAAADDSDTA